eukprot:TRINITY_DN12122_c0_g1_i2.p1 TRINITY_DN12122_c0_g1~~TRINITY_DN12122_c0_g1_i2.p1  ORF type:complete len:161 (+),score=22.40 TRINITY_DN12122_c0_g1_i2:77-559(+)
MSCSGSPASFEPHFVQKGSTDPSRTLAVERPRQGRRASPRWRHSARVIGRRFWVTSAAATSAALVTLSRASEQSPSLGGARTDWASQYGQDQLIFDRFFLAEADLSTIIFKEMKQKGLGEPLKNILDMWEANGDELSQWEAECPAGFLAIGLAQVPGHSF